MAILDDPAAYTRLDPSGLGGRIAAMPLQCRDAWVKALAFYLPGPYAKVDRALVLGMGGSAIGGDLLSDLQDFQGGAPVELHRGYGRATPPDERTLIVASSYSGNTEETLSALERAWRSGAKALALTSGGQLALRARTLGMPVLPIEVRAEPRCTAGYSFFALLGIFQRLQLAPDRSADVIDAITLMQNMVKEAGPDVPLDRNPAKRLAADLQHKVPIVLGAQHLRAAAFRWRTQIAENAKGLAFAEALPEWDHNGIEGLVFPQGAGHHLSYVLLESPLYAPRIALRCSLSREAMAAHGFPCISHAPQGKSPLAQVMSAVLFGDYVSYYLAILNGVDPSATPQLVALKERMTGEK